MQEAEKPFRSSTSFLTPTFDAPLDVAERIALVPVDRAVKGMFLQNVVESARRAGIILTQQPTYVAFKDYPMAEAMNLWSDIARRLHPNASTRESIRRLARLAFPAFASSLVGKVILAPLGNDVGLLLRTAPVSYRACVRDGRVVVADTGPSHCVLAYEDVYSFYDCLHIGVLEGVLESLGIDGMIRVAYENDRYGQLLCDW